LYTPCILDCALRFSNKILLLIKKKSFREQLLTRKRFREKLQISSFSWGTTSSGLLVSLFQ
jgi:hypothetical protein